MLAHVAGNLRRLRRHARLSQTALAAASGISRRMIVNLEAGGTNISLASLDRLAGALGATFVDMVSDPDAERRRILATVWRGEGPDSRAVLLGSAPARSQAQLWFWSLAPGECYPAEPDPAGFHEMIYVIAGRLRIALAEGPVAVEAGDFAVYGSDQLYAYENLAREATRFIRNVVR